MKFDASNISKLQPYLEVINTSISEAQKLDHMLTDFELMTQDMSLAYRLNNQVNAVNAKWGQNSAALLPTPEQTLRQLLASPISLTARIVSGESNKEIIAPEVASARFNYTDALLPLVLPKAENINRIALAPPEILEIISDRDPATQAVTPRDFANGI